ncbi:MAG: hypothetical protein IPM51_02360 [Sphingobacteriaceae bacterium]|nr:hypothetical protein [Sphingobacteriaceae bacterium]
MASKICPECGENIVGRTDKKFCSDICRNSFNNRLNSDGNNYVRNVNNILRRNRRVLESTIKNESKITVPKQKVVDKGFNFQYYTNQLTTRNNHVYHYVYEYGYMLLDNGMMLIVKRKND